MSGNSTMNSTDPSQVEDENAAPSVATTTTPPVATTLGSTLGGQIAAVANAEPIAQPKSRRVFRRPTAAVTTPAPAAEKPKRGRPAKAKAPKATKVEKPKRGRPAKAKAPKVAKKHVGRTPKEPGERFTNTILLRLNDEDYAKLQTVSKRQGLALAACTRMVVGKGLATFRVRK